MGEIFLYPRHGPETDHAVDIAAEGRERVTPGLPRTDDSPDGMYQSGEQPAIAQKPRGNTFI